MSLMHPRIAHSWAKNGYYPTDHETVERIINMLSVAQGDESLRIFDPCAGKGEAIQTLANYLGSESYAIEYDAERASKLSQCIDKSLHGDFFDTIISPQSFSLVWLNPPYGYVATEKVTTDKDKTERLEKLFFKRCLGLQQLGAILIFIVPITLIDDEMLLGLDSNYEQITFHDAVDTTYQQVVIIGKKTKTRRFDRETRQQHCLSLQAQLQQRVVLPKVALIDYEVPLATQQLKHCYSINIEPIALKNEVKSLHGGLWQDFTVLMGLKNQPVRQPLTKMSDWHLALALAAGAISGVITSPTTGKVLLIKGDTYKTKFKKVDMVVNDNDEITETVTMIDKFIPIIKAWDMTPHTSSKGHLLNITNTVSEHLFDLGKIVMTLGVQELEPSIVMSKLQLHQSENWGDLSKEDKQLNEQAIHTMKEGRLQTRLFSAYQVDTEKIWIITEWHEELQQNLTTLLLPSEY